MRVRHRRIHDRYFWFAEKVVDAGILRHRPAAFGLIVDVRLVGEVHFHRQNVADLVRALILEECARTVSP